MRLKSLYIISALLSVLFFSSCISGENGPVTLWENSKGDYNNYRIPSLLVTHKGTLLAFCEGREGGDAGNIDI